MGIRAFPVAQGASKEYARSILRKTDYISELLKRLALMTNADMPEQKLTLFVGKLLQYPESVLDAGFADAENLFKMPTWTWGELRALIEKHVPTGTNEAEEKRLEEIAAPYKARKAAGYEPKLLHGACEPRMREEAERKRRRKRSDLGTYKPEPTPEDRLNQLRAQIPECQARAAAYRQNEASAGVTGGLV